MHCSYCIHSLIISYRHSIQNGIEGEDYYYNRRDPEERFGLDVYQETPFRSHQVFASPICIPSVSPDELEVLVLAIEASAAGALG